MTRLRAPRITSVDVEEGNLVVKTSLPEVWPPRWVLRLCLLFCPVQDPTISDLLSEPSLPGTTAVVLSTSPIIINATYFLLKANERAFSRPGSVSDRNITELYQSPANTKK
ncbi:hypothetical protein AB1287_07675 [Enterobacter asburiae]|uniref:hypothetical protein n=1 Tax=Scandinavium sp. UTDF21-P1B TaxID=3446379 RepID=UPI00346AB5F7